MVYTISVQVACRWAISTVLFLMHLVVRSPVAALSYDSTRGVEQQNRHGSAAASDRARMTFTTRFASEQDQIILVSGGHRRKGRDVGRLDGYGSLCAPSSRHTARINVLSRMCASHRNISNTLRDIGFIYTGLQNDYAEYKNEMGLDLGEDLRLTDLRGTRLQEASTGFAEKLDTKTIIWKLMRLMSQTADSLRSMCDGDDSMLAVAIKRQYCLDKTLANRAAIALDWNRTRTLRRIKRRVCPLLANVESFLSTYNNQEQENLCAKLPPIADFQGSDAADLDGSGSIDDAANSANQLPAVKEVEWADEKSVYSTFTCSAADTRAHKVSAAFVQYVLGRVEHLWSVMTVRDDSLFPVSSWLTNARRRLIPRLTAHENKIRQQKGMSPLGVVKRKRKSPKK